MDVFASIAPTAERAYKGLLRLFANKYYHRLQGETSLMEVVQSIGVNLFFLLQPRVEPSWWLLRLSANKFGHRLQGGISLTEVVQSIGLEFLILLQLRELHCDNRYVYSRTNFNSD